MVKSREIWVDNVKIIACILVVLGHFFQSMVAAGIMNDTSLYRWFNQTIYMFHVPLFFICSEYLYQRYTRVNDINSWGKNVLKKFIALGIPYFTFSIVTWLLKTVFSDSVNGEVDGLAENLFLSPLSPYWYLYALFFCFVIIPTARSKRVMIVEIIIALVLKIIAVMEFSVPVQVVMYLLRYGIWFVLGMTIAEFEIPQKQSKKFQKFCGIILFLAFVILSVFIYIKNIQSALINFALGIIACIGLTWIIIGMFRDNKQNIILKFAAKYTMPVFLMHTIFAAGLRAVFMKIGIYSFHIHAVAGIVISFVGPIIAAKIMHRVKGLDFFLYPTKYIRIK